MQRQACRLASLAVSAAPAGPLFSSLGDAAAQGARAASTVAHGAAVCAPAPLSGLLFAPLPQHPAFLRDQPTGGAWLPPLAPAEELLLMAVPKRKVTPSRKGIRSTGKHLRFQPVVSRCFTCGRVKQLHWHCPHCTGAPKPVAAEEGGASEKTAES